MTTTTNSYNIVIYYGKLEFDRGERSNDRGKQSDQQSPEIACQKNYFIFQQGT